MRVRDEGQHDEHAAEDRASETPVVVEPDVGMEIEIGELQRLPALLGRFPSLLPPPCVTSLTVCGALSRRPLCDNCHARLQDTALALGTKIGEGSTHNII